VLQIVDVQLGLLKVKTCIGRKCNRSAKIDEREKKEKKANIFWRGRVFSLGSLDKVPIRFMYPR
jgi:hypothetical protein